MRLYNRPQPAPAMCYLVSSNWSAVVADCSLLSGCLVRCHRTFYVMYYYLFLCTKLSLSLSLTHTHRHKHTHTHTHTHAHTHTRTELCSLLNRLSFYARLCVALGMFRHTITSCFCICIRLRLCHTQLQEGED